MGRTVSQLKLIDLLLRCLCCQSKAAGLGIINVFLEIMFKGDLQLGRNVIKCTLIGSRKARPVELNRFKTSSKICSACLTT